MTMDRMVDYLEERGFKAERTYDPRGHVYTFTIVKDGVSVSDTYAYIPSFTSFVNHQRQENFLDNLIAKYEQEKACEAALKAATRNVINSMYGAPFKAIDTDALYIAAHNTYTDYYPYDQMFTHNIIQKGISAMQTYNKLPSIVKVVHNPPATIIFWADNTKTVVQTQNGEPYDPEKGFAMAVTKKVYGNKGNYFNTVKKWTETYKPEPEHIISAKPLSEFKKVWKVLIISRDGAVTYDILPHDYASKSSAMRKARNVALNLEDHKVVEVRVMAKRETSK